MVEKLKAIKECSLLGLDIGSKRLGIALWNPKSNLSSALPVRHRKTLKEDLAHLRHLISLHQIEGFVVGIPLSLLEKETESTKNALFWVEKLKVEFDIPVHTIDESFSTQEALSILRERGMNPKSKKAIDLKDSLSACLILEEFIRAQV